MTPPRRKINSHPKKVYIRLECGSGNVSDRIRYKDLDTDKLMSVRIEKGEDSTAKLEELREKLEDQLLSGNYETYESRIRKFIEIKERMEREKKNGSRITKNGKTLAVQQIATDEAEIASTTAYKGAPVVAAIDSLIADGKTGEADRLRRVLNRSPAAAYEMIDESFKAKKEGRIDTLITNKLGSLARTFDERCERKGGEEYRDDCMTVLKMLYKKFDEWRASE